jgi:hypothetical protein
MPPMRRRRLVTLLSALSFLLCATACALWVRSHSVADMVSRFDARGGYTLEASNGRIAANWDDVVYAGPGGAWEHSARRHPWDVEVPRPDPGGPQAGPDHRAHVDGLGFGLVAKRYADGGEVARCLVVPLWAVALASSVAPVTAVAVGWRRRARGGAGRCRSCGYDLRATPDRCPECGRVPTGAQA